MPRFSTKRYDQILTQFLAKIVSRTGLSDISDSSVLKHLLASVARGIDELYYNSSLLRDLFDIDRATGEDLDARAAEILPGIILRNIAVKASGNLVFSRQGTAGSVAVAIGAKVQTAGGQIFTTTAVANITPASPEQIAGHGVGRDSNLTSAVADIGGIAGNVALNTIVKFVAKPAGVDEVTNPSAFAYGINRESDDSFRARIKQFIAGLARSTVNALESGVLGVQDPATGQTILFSKAVEDVVDRGEVVLYIDDGTGSAETTATEEGTDLVAVFTWNGTTTVAATGLDTSEVQVGDFIGLKSDLQLFEITAITPNVDVTIDNTAVLAIPSGATTSFINPENMTEGLGGGGGDAAIGGETDLYLNNVPVKDAVAHYIVSSTRGILVENTDYIYNPADGHVVFLSALSADEYVFGIYVYYEGLIALGQLIVDGDPNDRATYPGIRAAGVRVVVQTPTVLIQNIVALITISEGYDHTTVESNVVEGIKEYVNGLGISGDVLVAELIWKIMSVSGVFNVNLTTPATDVTILDDQMARTTDFNISVN